MAIPTTPTNLRATSSSHLLAATATDAGFDIGWLAGAVTDETGYLIEWGRTTDYLDGQMTGGVDCLRCEIPNLPYNTPIYVRVKAFNEAGDSGYAELGAGSTNPTTTKPDVATISAAQGTGSDVVITVTEPVGPNSGAASYKVYYKKSSDTTYTAGETGASSPITVSSLDGETDYDFYVLATSSGGDGLPSNVETVETDAVVGYVEQDTHTGTSNGAVNFVSLSSRSNQAVKFVAGDTYTLTKVVLSLQRVLSPTALMTVSIYSHDAVNDEPDALRGTASGTVDSAGISATEGDVEFTGLSASITSGATYWIVLNGDTVVDSSNYVKWHFDSVGDFTPDETIMYSADALTWATERTDRNTFYTTYSGE